MSKYTFKASRVSGDGNAVFPDEIIIDENEGVLIFRKPKLIGSLEIKVMFGSISSIQIEKHIVFADIIIETRGGREIIARGFTRSDASTIKFLLS